MSATDPAVRSFVRRQSPRLDAIFSGFEERRNLGEEARERGVIAAEDEDRFLAAQGVFFEPPSDTAAAAGAGDVVCDEKHGSGFLGPSWVAHGSCDGLVLYEVRGNRS